MVVVSLPLSRRDILLWWLPLPVPEWQASDLPAARPGPGLEAVCGGGSSPGSVRGSFNENARSQAPLGGYAPITAFMYNALLSQPLSMNVE